MPAPPGAVPVAGARRNRVGEKGGGSGPPGNGSGTPAKESRENTAAITLQVLDERNRQRRQDAIRRALKDARRRRDMPSVRLLVKWLSDEAAA